MTQFRSPVTEKRSFFQSSVLAKLFSILMFSFAGYVALAWYASDETDDRLIQAKAIEIRPHLVMGVRFDRPIPRQKAHAIYNQKIAAYALCLAKQQVQDMTRLERVVYQATFGFVNPIEGVRPSIPDKKLCITLINNRSRLI